MKREQRNEAIKKLKENGYKRVPNLPYLYLSEYGKIYNLKLGKMLNATSRNMIFIDGRYLSLPKLMLFTFRNTPMRDNQQIRYLDGDRGNISLANIEYVRKFETGLKTTVNAKGLYTAIRCYFEVPKKYNVKDHILTRMYLKNILSIRGFYIEHHKSKYIEIFKSYMSGCTNSCLSVAKENKIHLSDCSYIVNSSINQLVIDILSDLELGILQQMDYQPRPKTKTQELREVNKYLVANGGTPVRLRKQSDKEILRDYEKYINEFKTKCL